MFLQSGLCGLFGKRKGVEFGNFCQIVAIVDKREIPSPTPRRTVNKNLRIKNVTNDHDTSENCMKTDFL